MLTAGNPIVIDWQPAILAIVDDLSREQSVGLVALKFHNMLAETIVAVLANRKSFPAADIFRIVT